MSSWVKIRTRGVLNVCICLFICLILLQMHPFIKSIFILLEGVELNFIVPMCNPLCRLHCDIMILYFFVWTWHIFVHLNKKLCTKNQNHMLLKSSVKSLDTIAISEQEKKKKTVQLNQKTLLLLQIVLLFLCRNSPEMSSLSARLQFPEDSDFQTCSDFLTFGFQGQVYFRYDRSCATLVCSNGQSVILM